MSLNKETKPNQTYKRSLTFSKKKLKEIMVLLIAISKIVKSPYFEQSHLWEHE